MHKTLMILVTAFMTVAMVSSMSSAQDTSSYIKKGSTEDVAYASGGIGIEERQVMDRMAKDFNLKLVFTVSSGAYLSDIMVVIQDDEGKTLVHTASNGPWFLVKLAKGQYTITVGNVDQQKTQKVSVGEGLQTVVFDWR
jgi:hypothetical protein